jgi:hypothetical protein
MSQRHTNIIRGIGSDEPAGAAVMADKPGPGCALAAGGAEAGILAAAAAPDYRAVSAGSWAGRWLPASR